MKRSKATLIKSNVHDLYDVTWLRPHVVKGFQTSSVSSNDNHKLYVDWYRRSDGTDYYRVSFYVDSPPSSQTWFNGEQVRDNLNAGPSGLVWNVSYCRAVSRDTDAIKVYALVDA